MTDQPNNMTADDLLAYLEECSKRLRPAQETVLSEIKTENLRDNGASNTLKRNDNIEFLHFSAAGREDIYAYAHAREREVRDPLTHTCIFNSIFYGEKEKRKEKPTETAGSGFSVGVSLNGDLSENSENPRKCCLCGQPILTPVDTLWGADPCHRPCAEKAFQANKAVGKYKS